MKAKKNFIKHLELNNSTNNIKAELFSMLEDFSMADINNLGPSDPNGKIKQSQAAQAQAQETLKQQQNVPAPTAAKIPGMMSQEDFDKLPNITPADGVVIKRGQDGKFYFYSSDPSKLALYTPPSAIQQSTPQLPPPSQKVAEAYDFMDASIFEDTDIVAPMQEPSENLDIPGISIKPIKLEIEIKTVDEDDEDEDKDKKKDKDDDKKEDKKKKDTEDKEEEEYDMFANLPPLDLSDDIQRAVQDAQQDMMPNIRLLPTDVQKLAVMRDGPIGSLKPVTRSNIKSIEEDPLGLSVVGMDNDMALRLM